MEFRDTSEIPLSTRLGSLLTRDLLGRRPPKFIAALDAFNQELIGHLGSPAHYPEIVDEPNYWECQGAAKLAWPWSVGWSRYDRVD